MAYQEVSNSPWEEGRTLWCADFTKWADLEPGRYELTAHVLPVKDSYLVELGEMQPSEECECCYHWPLDVRSLDQEGVSCYQDSYPALLDALGLVNPGDRTYVRLRLLDTLT